MEGMKDTSKEENISGSDDVSQLVASTFKIFHFPWKTPILIGLCTLSLESVCTHLAFLFTLYIKLSVFRPEQDLCPYLSRGWPVIQRSAINTQGTRNQ